MAETSGRAEFPGAEQVRGDARSWPTGRLLSVAARVLEVRFERFLAGYDLTQAGLVVLHHVEEGPRSQRELSLLCRVTDQTMSRTVEKLTRYGHVRRGADVGDRRRLLVEITESGQVALDGARVEERKSEQFFGALPDYGRFRDDLIALIGMAEPPSSGGG
ncbi:MarR family winged helix-turn-helix transcriptional regulator [Actinokineospora guangxiensis]|uniref:MarR family winged helix-turn-helix transcriptional regulator n=1 Tax=Actinokineospora guangxiensis TaxID=1490288 RepID=A0ABW0ETM1_9PSEU